MDKQLRELPFHDSYALKRLPKSLKWFLHQEEQIKPDHTEKDVLYEILLKSGLDLTLPIEERNNRRKKGL
ncbi:MAG: hypothetical protein OXC03_02115 [Flavobacteriaceae bacterium]|nr:hypothetical protein [Flavobacteriaceae bacterium]